MRAALVPVGALEDPGLALEPEPVRLLDVLATRCEDVEDEAAVGQEERACRAQRTQLLVLGLHVQQRAKRADDERSALVDRRLAQVADAKVDEVVRRLLPRRHARATSSIPGEESTPITSTPAFAIGNGDPSRPDGELDDRTTGRERVVDVELDVLGDRATPRVVERRDRVVERHAGLRATHTNSRLSSSNGRRSNQP